MSPWAMSGAAGQVRGINGTLQSLVNDLVSEGVWSGADAERFAQDWTDQVHIPLLNAASNMDGVSFEPMAEG